MEVLERGPYTGVSCVTDTSCAYGIVIGRIQVPDDVSGGSASADNRITDSVDELDFPSADVAVGRYDVDGDRVGGDIADDQAVRAFAIDHIKEDIVYGSGRIRAGGVVVFP